MSDDEVEFRPLGGVLDVVVGMPVTWLNVPRGGYGFACAVDAVVMKVCDKGVRIEVSRADGSRVERMVTRATLRAPAQTHPMLMQRRISRIVRLRMEDLAKELAAWSFVAGSSEAVFQRCLVHCLGMNDRPQRFGQVDTEVIAERGRYDVMLKDDIATIVLELKVKGTAAAVERQAQRYALTPSVDGVMVVTTSQRLAAQLKPGDLGGKPFGVAVVRTYI